MMPLVNFENAMIHTSDAIFIGNIPLILHFRCFDFHKVV